MREIYKKYRPVGCGGAGRLSGSVEDMGKTGVMGGSSWGLSESLRGKGIDTQQGLVPGLIPQMLRWLALVRGITHYTSPLNDGPLWSSSPIIVSYWALNGDNPSSSIDRGAGVRRTKKDAKIFASAGGRVSGPLLCPVDIQYSTILAARWRFDRIVQYGSWWMERAWNQPQGNRPARLRRSLILAP